jgi:hypothetical protein
MQDLERDQLYLVYEKCVYRSVFVERSLVIGSLMFVRSDEGMSCTGRYK